MNPPDLRRLRELEPKATPGPWYADVPEQNGMLTGGGSIWRMKWASRIMQSEDHNPNRLPDAALIAEMRNALPALLECVEALERSNAEHERQLHLVWDDREKAEARLQSVGETMRECVEALERIEPVLEWAFEQLRMWWRGVPRDMSDPNAALAEIDRMETACARLHHPVEERRP